MNNTDMDKIELMQLEGKLEQALIEYFDDLKTRSDCPKTIKRKPFKASDLKLITPEHNAEMRDEFDDQKAALKKEWEKINSRKWPKYTKDVYSANGKLIRNAGTDYDAHHIHPLGMGGKNEASNITPLHAEVHYDKQGIHAPNSPYTKMNQLLVKLGEKQQQIQRADATQPNVVDYPAEVRKLLNKYEEDAALWEDIQGKMTSHDLFEFNI